MGFILICNNNSNINNNNDNDNCINNDYNHGDDNNSNYYYVYNLPRLYIVIIIIDYIECEQRVISHLQDM